MPYPPQGTGLSETEVDAKIAAKSHPTIVRKTADEIVNNSDILQDDDELFLAVGANEIWSVFLYLIATTGVDPDFKFAFTVPVGGSISLVTHGDIGSSSQQAVVTERDGTIAMHWWGAFTNGVILVWGRYVGGANAGNLQLQWAQNTADVSDTKVLANSFLKCTRIA